MKKWILITACCLFFLTAIAIFYIKVIELYARPIISIFDIALRALHAMLRLLTGQVETTENIVKSVGEFLSGTAQ